MTVKAIAQLSVTLYNLPDEFDDFFDNHNRRNEQVNRLRNEPKAIFRKITEETYGTNEYDSVICLEDCFEKVRDLRIYKEDDGCFVFIMVFIDFVLLTVPHILIALYKSMTEGDKG